MTIWFALLMLGLGWLPAAWLYARVRSLQQRLGEQSRAQTRATRHRLNHAVRQRTAQLTELALHLQSAREDERQRLARDLHDELGSLLTSAKLDAARMRVRIGPGTPDVQERLAHLVGTLNDMIALKRGIVEDLHPSALTHLGLVPALEILVNDYGTRSGMPVHCDLCSVSLPASAELMVYRVVQEAITNISKHAHARHVMVQLAAHSGRVDLSVRDDGRGFDPGAAPRSAYGLVGMRFRVEAEGGRLDVVSAPRRGTTIRLSLPELAAA